MSEAIEGCRPQTRDGELMGRYLFNALLGHETWRLVREEAAHSGASLIELALVWDSTETTLHGLKWELLHDGTDFLAVYRELPVAITRVVREAPAVQVATIEAPVRVLFAVGTELADPRMRAGAEIMGLLRRAEQGNGAITPRVLEDASLATLAGEVARFQPQVVHFVTHGRVRDGRGQLQMRDSGGDDTGGDETTTYVEGQALLAALHAGESAPRIVVLTACESAGSVGHTTPLAVELVNGGIPIVVGMTGDVSDPACRLFSHEFGTVLTGADPARPDAPLVAALTHGRRAALWSSGAPTDRIDWALPALFLGPSVPADHVAVDARGASRVLKRIHAFGLMERPVFCGRREFVRALDELLDPYNPLTVLAAFAERHDPKLQNPQLGKTRLLHELTRQALRAGHVVVLPTGRLGSDSDPPTTLDHLAAMLIRAIATTRRNLELELPATGYVLRLMEDALGDSAELASTTGGDRWFRLTRFLHRWRVERRTGSFSADLLHQAVALDLQELAADARSTPDVRDDARVLVLLEDIQRWGSLAPTVTDTFLTHHGLGTADEAIPVVLACTAGEVHRELIQALRERARHTTWIRTQALGPFCEKREEDTLAYQWVLLNPPPNATAYTVRPRADIDWRKPFRSLITGVPGMLQSDAFVALTAAFEETRDFVGHNDAQELQVYRKNGGGG